MSVKNSRLCLTASIATIAILGATASARAQTILKNTLTGSTSSQSAFPSYSNQDSLGGDYNVVFQPVTLLTGSTITSITVRGFHAMTNPTANSNPQNSSYTVGFYSNTDALQHPLAPDLGTFNVQPVVTTISTLSNGLNYLQFQFNFASAVSVPTGQFNIGIWGATLPVALGAFYEQTTTTADVDAFTVSSSSQGTKTTLSSPVGMLIQGSAGGAASAPEPPVGMFLVGAIALQSLSKIGPRAIRRRFLK